MSPIAHTLTIFFPKSVDAVYSLTKAAMALLAIHVAANNFVAMDTWLVLALRTCVIREGK